MEGVALRAYMRLGWETSAWLGWLGLAGLPLLSDIFFISEKSNTEYNKKGGHGERKG
jgi:hypothetical protein